MRYHEDAGGKTGHCFGPEWLRDSIRRFWIVREGPLARGDPDGGRIPVQEQLAEGLGRANDAEEIQGQ